MKMLRKDVWKFTKEKRENLKGVYMKARIRFMKQEIILERGELDEWRKGGDLQHNIGWKWEVGTRRG